MSEPNPEKFIEVNVEDFEDYSHQQTIAKRITIVSSIVLGFAIVQDIVAVAVTENLTHGLIAGSATILSAGGLALGLRKHEKETTRLSDLFETARYEKDFS